MASTLGLMANGPVKDQRNGVRTLERRDSLTTISEGDTYDSILAACAYIRMHTRHRPTIGIVCGSGLGGLADIVQEADYIDYADIPNFPISTAPGHVGRLVIGRIHDVVVLCMQGRAHFYEGHSARKTTFPIRTMKLLGIHTLILTNAAGALNHKYRVGDVMLIRDHISLQALSGYNPLVGENDDRFGPRFFALSDAYDKSLRQLVHRAAKDLGLSSFLHEGVYMQQGGPAFESVAECRMMRILGADVVGMSTTPEVICARHCGIRIMAMSLVTNMCVIDDDSAITVNHEGVLQVAGERALQMQSLIGRICKEISSYPTK